MNLGADLVDRRQRPRLEDAGVARRARIRHGQTVDEVQVGIGYTTRIFKRRAERISTVTSGAIIAPKPPRQMRVGFMLAMEDDRWIVTLGGWMGHHCPPDPASFLEFAESLARPTSTT